jgi:hypothetical protein
VLSAAAKGIQNRTGGHVANGVRFQKVFPPVVLKGLEWKQVQYAVSRDENPVSIGNIHPHAISPCLADHRLTAMHAGPERIPEGQRPEAPK